MRKLWIAFLTLVALAAPVRADDAALAAAKELTDFTFSRTVNDMIDKVSGAMWTNIQATLANSKIDADTQTEIKAEFDRVMKKYVGQALDQAPAVYARHFSADELHALLAFYKTPLGDKVLNEMPKVMGDFTNTAFVPLMAPMQAEIRTSITAIMQKHGYGK